MRYAGTYYHYGMAYTGKDTLRVHRTRAGLTQAEVAQRLGIREATVSEHESGKAIPSGILLQEYARLYECDANDIDLKKAAA